MKVILVSFAFLGMAFAAPSSACAQEIGKPMVRVAQARTSSAALAPVPLMKAWQPGDPVRVRSDLRRRAERGQPPAGRLQVSAPDPLLQNQILAGSGAQPAIRTDFDGIPSSSEGYTPPDIVGAVGPNHYIQMVNVAIAIFDKSGQRLFGPSPINSLWRGFGGPCEGENNGDPIARYDHLADRWLVSQFALDDHFQCIAISRGPNPVTDGWFLYAFSTVTADGTAVTPDYPKITIWSDGYYMGTQRGFPTDGLDVWVFERDKMLTGQAARQVQFSIGAPSLFLMPSDLDGPPPPLGTPNYFIRHVDGQLFGGQDRLELFKFSVDWSDPSKSTFQLEADVPTTPFSAMLCGDIFSGNCATQPSTSVRLETLPAWIMWRLQYRNFGTHQTLLTSHTVAVNSAGDRTGVRWYELRRDGNGPWTKRQEGTHSPDSNHRFMPSIAMDGMGNIALGYSVSGPTIFPSIRLASRRENDPLGTISGEITLREGRGSQTSVGARWGDYSSMEVDPVEPCTFWYSNQYYPATSEVGWRTRITAVKLPECSSR